MKSPKPLLIALTTSIAATSGGCASMQIADSGCKSFKPITWSKNDTAQTKKEVVSHNKAFDAVCPSKG